MSGRAITQDWLMVLPIRPPDSFFGRRRYGYLRPAKQAIGSSPDTRMGYSPEQTAVGLTVSDWFASGSSGEAYGAEKRGRTKQ